MRPDLKFVVYKDHDGWFKVCHDYWWDDLTFTIDGQRIDTREEIGRFKDMLEAFEVRGLYNQMVYGHDKPHLNMTRSNK